MTTIAELKANIKSGMAPIEAARQAGFPCEPFNKHPGIYVYFLCDPETNEVFYVGKGRGRRCLQHESEAARNAGRNVIKRSTIQNILLRGLRTLIICVDSGLTEDVAFQLERALIHAIGFGNLTNIMPGHIHPEEAAFAEICNFRRLLHVEAENLALDAASGLTSWHVWRLSLIAKFTKETVEDARLCAEVLVEKGVTELHAYAE